MSGERRIASDTGPLITLEKLSNGYRFIRLLYDKILIPLRCDGARSRDALFIGIGCALSEFLIRQVRTGSAAAGAVGTPG